MEVAFGMVACILCYLITCSKSCSHARLFTTWVYTLDGLKVSSLKCSLVHSTFVLFPTFHQFGNVLSAIVLLYLNYAPLNTIFAHSEA
jgi:hypothetical protein